MAAAGGVEHEELVKLSEKAFSGLSTDPTTAYDLVAKASSLPTLLESSHHTIYGNASAVQTGAGVLTSRLGHCQKMPPHDTPQQRNARCGAK